MIAIDGSAGEGGGQVLRTSLSLALVTGQAFRIENLRARRAKPGLLRQHLTAVHAAARVSDAEVEGGELGSQTLVFRPGTLRAGSFHFDIGSAGSTTLVVQTLLPALLAADAPSELVVEGGTHNPLAPPFEFLERCFVPQLARMGARVELVLERHGFHPAGGGRIRARVEPVRLRGIEIVERGVLRSHLARAIVSSIPTHVAERELAVVRERLGWTRAECEVVSVPDPRGHGNVVLLEHACEHVTELVASFGARGLPAERVARTAVDGLERHLATPAPVGEHLADQLLIPFALARGGTFVTGAPSGHTRTNAEVVQRFLDARIELRERDADTWSVSFASR